MEMIRIWLDNLNGNALLIPLQLDSIRHSQSGDQNQPTAPHQPLLTSIATPARAGKQHN